MIYLISIISFIKFFNISDYKDCNFYQLLGIQKTSTIRDITRSYKRFLVQKNRIISPSERTLKIWRQTELAHEILTNPSSKELYDLYGNDFLNSTDFSILGYQSDMQIELMKQVYKDIPADLGKFGGIITYPIQFSLLEFLKGSSKTIQVMRTVACLCPRGGTKCAKCRKSPFMTQLVTEKIILPPGAPEFHRILIKDLVDSPQARGASDVLFIIYSKEDEKFIRNGSDLYINVTISLSEAIEGNIYKFNNIDDEEISFSIEGIQHGQQRKIKNKGLPFYYDPKKRGDIIITFFIEFPESLTNDQKKIIKETLPDDISFYE